jgi:hypothetical protein
MCASAACHDDKKFCNASCQAPDVAQRNGGNRVGAKCAEFTEKGDGGIVGKNGRRTRTLTIRLGKHAVFCADLLIPVLVVPPPLFFGLLALREVQIVRRRP